MVTETEDALSEVGNALAERFGDAASSGAPGLETAERRAVVAARGAFYQRAVLSASRDARQNDQSVHPDKLARVFRYIPGPGAAATMHSEPAGPCVVIA